MSEIERSDEQKIELLEMSTVMSSESGRNVLSRILAVTGVDIGTFNTDPLVHAKNAGRREVGLELKDVMMAASPGNYIKILKENIDD